MLNIVVEFEEPVKYKKKNDFNTQRAENERKLAELQDKILNQIAGSSENILEDDELIKTLDESKDQFKIIDQQLKEMESTVKSID